MPLRVTAKQRDLFTRRYRTVKMPEPSELQIHSSLVAQLRGKVVQLLRDDVVMFHIPNGEIRDIRTAAKLKAMGVLPGVADLQFMWKEAPYGWLLRVLFLELKAPGKKPTDSQLLFKTRAEACGAYWACADNIDDALRIVGEYGLLK
jgi:hypothetical protein